MIANNANIVRRAANSTSRKGCLAYAALTALLLAATSSCGQLLGTDDFAVDPAFAVADSGENEPEPEPETESSGTETENTTSDTEDTETSEPESSAPTETATEETDTEVTSSSPSDTEITMVGTDSGSSEPTSSSETSSGETSSSETSSEPTNTEIPDPVDAGVDGGDVVDCVAPISGSCDNVPQCGCEGANCEFDLDNTGATSCVSAGTVAPYGACTETSAQCPAGYSCVGSVCKEFCSGDELTCTQGEFSECFSVVASEVPIPGFFVCTRTCDPVNPAQAGGDYLACGPGMGCRPSSDGVSDCIPASAAGITDSECADVEGLADPSLCAPGFACAFADASALTPTCTGYCALYGNDCAPGWGCTSFPEPQYSGGQEYGACQRCNVPPDGTCALFPQCGCNPDEMCTYSSSPATACVLASPRALNDECSPTEPCGPGLDCLWVDDQQRGVCTQWCETVSDCPNPNGTCLDLGLVGANYCLQGCDPRDPTNGQSPFFACGAGQVCAPVTDGDGLCALPNVLGVSGDPCVIDVDCSPGLGCDALSQCSPWCMVGGSDCATASSSCFVPARAPLSAANSFGFCAEALATFSNTTTAPIEDLTTTTSTLSVTTALTLIERVTVEVNIVHSWVADLQLELVAPDGTRVRLVSGDVLDSSSNLQGTRFDDSGTDIALNWTSPYTGAFVPEVALGTLTGLDPNGVWTLEVRDVELQLNGTLVSWSLHFW
jgi:subtilisin-like proprotein convertase family protein